MIKYTAVLLMLVIVVFKYKIHRRTFSSAHEWVTYTAITTATNK